jgi:hypothetical protein
MGVRRPRAPRFGAAVLLVALAGGCDYPFEPFRENTEGPFSLFGYLDLRADTQWVRVMPVRRALLPGPEPLDVVVTLERIGGGWTVSLNDSVFAFTDPQLGSTAYVHNFWTAERLEAGASYRLRAVRADGASTEALVVMPPTLELTLLNSGGFNGVLTVRAEHLLFVEVVHTMATADGKPSSGVAVRQTEIFPGQETGTHRIFVKADSLEREELLDVRREEIRVAVARADWPYDPGLPDLDALLPGVVPTNVENGFGYVGGVATWTIPFHHCHAVAAEPDAVLDCPVRFDAESASLEGRVVWERCNGSPALPTVRLTERFTDGSEFIRSWKAGWDGRYRFEGITPGAELSIEVMMGTTAVALPPLGPGERGAVGDLHWSPPC